MDDAVTRVLDIYHKRIDAEAKRTRFRSLDEFLLAVGPAVGSVMNLLIKETEAKAILELGTSYGYSTLWLAEAARAVGGKVFSLDTQKYKQDYAREALAQAELAKYVEFKAGDAVEILKTTSRSFDFVLVDLWKDMYVPCLDLFYPKLKPGALIVADNMIEPVESRADAAIYRSMVRGKPGIQSALLPIGTASSSAAMRPGFRTTLSDGSAFDGSARAEDDLQHPADVGGQRTLCKGRPNRAASAAAARRGDRDRSRRAADPRHCRSGLYPPRLRRALHRHPIPPRSLIPEADRAYAAAPAA